MSTVAAFLAIMTSSTPVAMGFLVIPGSEHFGVTTGQFLIYFTLFLLTSAVLFSFTGRLINRVGVRIVLIIGGLISAFAWIGMAFAPNIYVFYFLAFIMGVGAAGNNLLPANTLVTGWHVHKRRGTMLGIVATGGATGGMIIGFVFPTVMKNGGFVGGAIGIGVMIFICSVLSGVFLAKNPPRPGEEFADEAEIAASSKSDRKVAIKGFGIAVALLAVASFLFALEGAFSTVQAAVYQSFGIDLQTAGLMIAFYSLFGILSKPLLGFMHDKMGMKPLFIALGILYILGLPALALSMQLGLNMTFPILAIAALSLSVPGVIIPLVAVTAAGRERFPIIYGFMLTGSYTGTGIGVPIWGVVYDMTGEFSLAMYAGGAAGLIGLVLVYLGLLRGVRHRDSLNEPTTMGIFLPEEAGLAASIDGTVDVLVAESQVDGTDEPEVAATK